MENCSFPLSMIDWKRESTGMLMQEKKFEATSI